MKTLTNKKGTLQVEWNEDNTNAGIVLVLKQGAKLNPVGASFTQSDLITLRNTKTTTDASGNIFTTEDLTFKSKSALATFIQGGQTNGQAYCERTFGIPKVGSTIQNSSKEEGATNVENPTKETPTESSTPNSQELADKIITFCKDFEFKPDPRLLNSLLFEQNPSQFIVDTMRLTNYPQELIDLAESKFKCREWKDLMKTLKSVKPTHGRFNQRLEIYYGAAGTGKTTLAKAKYPNAVKLVASASADPDDLFTAFNPETKKYELTALGSAAVQGQPIIIDEANLYNQVCLERLQGITDADTSIKDRTFDINIKEGFKVIITMNLETNMGKFPLPSPLVSRASEIKYFDNVRLDWVW